MESTIHVDIGKLVLHGFNYHDHRRIATAVEQELGRLIRVSGLPEARNNRSDERGNMDLGSFKLPNNMDPKLIGAEIAKSIFKDLRR